MIRHYARTAAGLAASLVALALVAAWVGLGALLDDEDAR